MNDMKSCALELFDKGYNIVPVLPGQKRMQLKNWTSITRDRVQVENWIATMPGHNVGTLTKDTPFIDIDITDSVITSKIYMLLLSIFPKIDISTRTGKAPKLAIPCMLPHGFKPFKKLKSNIYTEVASGIDQAVEILADGQMCLMKGIHPDTQAPYTWDSEEVPNVQDLPTLTPRVIDMLFEKFEELAAKKVASGAWILKSESTASSHENLQPAQKKKRKKPKTRYTIPQLQAVLNDIPELNHDDWLKLGMGLHHQFEGGPAGEMLWKYFSAKTPTTYNADEIHARYATLNKDKHSAGITIGSVINFRNVALAKKEPTPIFELTDPTVLEPTITPLEREPTHAQIQEQVQAQVQVQSSNLSALSAVEIAQQAEATGILPTTNTQNKVHAPTTNTQNKVHAPTPNSTNKTKVPVTTNKTPNSNQPKPKWYSGWYFISSLNKLYNAITSECIKPDSFNFLFANEMTILGDKGSATNHVARLNLIPKMSGIAYLPGASRLFSTNNQKFVNSYNQYIPKGKVPDKYTEPTLLVEYMRRMMHDPYEHGILMDFMAHIVQNPGRRVGWSPILLGVQGTGKTTILEIMTIALGSTNAKPVSAELFTNSFNSYAEGSMFVFVEEIKISGDNRHRVLDRIKGIITNAIINLTNKGQDSRDIRNVTSYMLGTNHPDALPIDDEDRRYAVLQTILDLSVQEFAKLYAFLNNEDNHWDIHQWLLRHPISSGFNAQGRAPETLATKSMVANTEDLLISKIQEAIDKNTKMINSSLVSFTAIKEAVADDMASLNDKSLGPRIRSKLIQMNYTRSGTSKRTYTIGGVRHTLYEPNINLQRSLKLANDHFEKALERAQE